VLDQGASLVLMSHLGRPKGFDRSLSLAPCAKRLSELLGKKVILAPDCVGPVVEKMALGLKAGEVLLLENLRFHAEEEKPNTEFVEGLAKLGDVYVNDAFGTAHRAHASTALIAKFFPGRKAAGFLMEKEIAALQCLIHNPKRPFHALIGGSKISTKIGLIQQLLKKVDLLFIGGAMTFTFLKAQGIEVGDSLLEMDQLETAKGILKAAKKEQICFPIDLVITDGAAVRTVSAVGGIPPGWKGMDIGPKTVEDWSLRLAKAATVFWNGPVGVFEMPKFSLGTMGLAKALASSRGRVVVGGGETVAAIEQAGLSKQFYHLSTGGGASLEYLEYGHLPGIDALAS
jgi:phosphoglycerate kinase